MHRHAHVFTVKSGDHAPELIELPHDAACSHLLVSLDKGQPLRVRVVNAQGKPVPEVEIVPVRWRNRSSLGYEPWVTDSDGTFVWDHAPSDPVTYWLSHPDFDRLELEFQPSAATQTVILQTGAGVEDTQ